VPDPAVAAIAFNPWKIPVLTPDDVIHKLEEFNYQDYQKRKL